MYVWKDQFDLPFVHENLLSLTLSMITSVNASKMAVLTLISCFRKFRKKAIVEEKPLCAVLWRVFARGCLRCRHESFVGLSPNEKKILPEARTARQDAASGELSRRVKEL